MDESRRNVVLVKGRAGSGKTALLMRLAYELHAKGRVVVWLDRSVNLRIAEIIDRVALLAPDVVMIDDVNVFGDSSVALLSRLNRGGRTAVVATIRRTQIWTLDGANLTTVDGDVDLSDLDLAALIERLSDAGLLGVLQGATARGRIERLREMCRRDLLSALIEVVTGQQFEDRVVTEYGELGPHEKSVYTAICLAEYIHETAAIPEEDFLQISGPVNEYANFRVAVETLIEDRKLVLRHEGGVIARHRAIADAVVSGLGPGVVAEYLGRMLRMYAARASHTRDQSNPDRRIMVHLLSHAGMRRLGLRKEEVREIYGSVQATLQGDFHYWLQRGAFEVEHDDPLGLAGTYLNAARSLPGGSQDRLVATEWGFMCLRRAVRSPHDRALASQASAALEELFAVTRVAGASSPHTFAVAIQHGTEWLTSSRCLSEADVLRVAGKLADLMQVGDRVCRDNHEVSRTIQLSRPAIASILTNVSPSPRYPL